MGDAVERLGKKIDPNHVALTRIFIPPYVRVREGQVEQVDSYWREIDSVADLSPDELRAVAPTLQAGVHHLPTSPSDDAVERLQAKVAPEPEPVVSPDPSNQATYPDRPELQEAYDRLNIGDRDLDELHAMMEDPLDVHELEVVTNEIAFLNEEEGLGEEPPWGEQQSQVDWLESRLDYPPDEPGGNLPTRPRLEVTDEGIFDVTGQPDLNPADLPGPAPERLTPSGHRSLSDIASEVRRDWKQPNFAAKPYLDALGSLDDIKDQYGADSASSVVSYFLANASSWRGPRAKEIKAELKAILKKR